MTLHERFNELEKAIDAMYDRPDYGERAWSVEKCELEIELESVKARIAEEQAQ